jgi:hypothetical protein
VRYFWQITDSDREIVKQTRQTIRASHELLERPLPDMFLGRQTHATFPLPEDAEE